MSELTVTGSLLTGGSIALKNLTGFRLESSLSSPAVSFSCQGPVEVFPGQLGEIRVEHGGRELFRGRVDKQTARLDSRGRTLSLEARDRGALLLDNEATPEALANLHLTTLFARCVAPYGFGLYAPRFAGSLALYTVHKGLCQWDAFCGFARRVYGRTPWVRGDTVHVDRPQTGGGVLLGHGGHPFSGLEWSRVPYNIISQVVLRDADGNYSATVRNSGAGYYGVERTRYVIPANEFVDTPALDANQRIRRSMLAGEAVSVTCPGLVDILPGQDVRVADENLVLSGLMAETLEVALSDKGLVTTVRLVSSVYYD